VHTDQIWENAAAPELKAVLRKLETRFGAMLRLLPSSPAWLSFQVYGLTDENLIRLLEREQNDIFGNQCLHHSVWKNLRKEEGVSIEYKPGLSQDAGFWYY
jgi:hypothetical protein